MKAPVKEAADKHNWRYDELVREIQSVVLPKLRIAFGGYYKNEIDQQAVEKAKSPK